MSESESNVSADLPHQSCSGQSSGGRMRQIILFVLLALMLGALWYDYKIARPNVQAAYDRIESLNNEINQKKGKEILTNKEVQTALDRPPSRVFSTGGYRVEVYSWRAGLPIKTRDYFAVFSDASPNRFLKHYVFALPTEELTGNAAYVTPPDPSVEGPQTLELPKSDLPAGSGKHQKTKEASDETESDQAKKESKDTDATPEKHDDAGNQKDAGKLEDEKGNEPTSDNPSDG